ncbi:MAG: hypothetical protein QT10_C0010G0009 [archaeon GW2011_AR19]|nr:MAG: hypothetical protein QT10_C0010G0009 [archaeon GW2011_AR19]
MNTKNKIFVFVIILISLAFVFAGKSFLSAQLTEIEGISSEDFTYQGENVEIQGEVIVCKSGFDNCKIQVTPKVGEAIALELTKGVKYDPASGKISVAKSGAIFKIGDETLSNINSGNLVINQNTGEISQAKFTTNSKGGDYNINGNQFNVPGDKEFIYPSEDGGYKFPDGAEVVKAQPGIQIESDEIINYKGNKVSGVLNFDEGGNAFVAPTRKANINDISITGAPKENVYVYFNSETAKFSGKTNYVVVDENIFEYKIGKETQAFEVSFGEKNPYLSNFEENDLFGLTGGALGEEGHLIINKGFVENGIEYLPSIKTSGSVSMLNDGIRLEPIEKSQKRNGEFILRDYAPGKNKGAVEIISISEMSETIKIGSVVDNKGRVFFTSNHESGEPLTVRDLTKGSVSGYSGSLELPLFPDIFSEKIKMSKSYVNLFDDKPIMTLTRNYKTADKGLERFQSSERDNYLKAFQKEHGIVKGTKYYNNLKDIVTNPTFTANKKTLEINKLILENDGPPPEVKAPEQVVGYVRDISNLAYELRKREVDVPFSEYDFLGAKEIAGIDKIIKDEKVNFKEAFDLYQKRTGIVSGPKFMFQDTSIPIKTWIEALEF